MNKWVKGILITVGIILILGIIATPIINSIYESQLEKTRDNSRISDIKGLQTSIEQTYADFGEYPLSLTDEKLATYLYGKVKDLKDGETINGCTFGYIYEVFEKDQIPNNGYRISSCLESKSNKNKLTLDGGIYENKFEVGNF